MRRLRRPGAAGPPVVFLHDSLGCISAWRDFPERLCEAAGREGLLYDRAGYGGSSPGPERRTLGYLHDEAGVLGEVLGACGVERAALFGHSDGGTIALLAAALAPERVEAVVTVGAHVMVEERTLAGLREALPWWDDQRFRQAMTRHHGDKAEAVFRIWTETWLSEPFRTWEMLDELRGVRCPALIIQGERDEYATAEHVETIVRGIAGPATGWIVPGAGHTPHREDDRVLEATRAFLASAAGA